MQSGTNTLDAVKLLWAPDNCLLGNIVKLTFTTMAWSSNTKIMPSLRLHVRTISNFLGFQLSNLSYDTIASVNLPFPISEAMVLNLAHGITYIAIFRLFSCCFFICNKKILKNGFTIHLAQHPRSSSVSHCRCIIKTWKDNK